MLPFPKHSESYVVTNFDLLHIDVWGPFHVAYTSGCKYFLTIVVDHSRATCKQNVFQNFQNFVAYVSNHFHTTIKAIDNGSEFINHSS